MTKAGTKIIEGLKEALAGNFSRVTIEGQTWERVGRRPIDDVMRGAMVMTTGLQITIACDDHDTKDAIVNFLTGEP